MLIWCAILALGSAAVAGDIARRRISNWIPISAFIFGLIYHVGGNSWRGGISALLGTFVGALVFLIFYVVGGMGGGDIKLMAGFGAILGANGILVASLWAAVVGGIMAVTFLMWNAAHKTTKQRSWNPGKRMRDESMPYAPAIAVGVWLSQLANY